MIYNPANENLWAHRLTADTYYAAVRGYTGSPSLLAGGAWRGSHRGSAGLSVDTGRRVWTHTFPRVPELGPMRATVGGSSSAAHPGPFFSAGLRRGHRRAALWEFPDHSGIVASPRRSASAAISTSRLQSRLGHDALRPCRDELTSHPGDYPDVPEGGAVWLGSRQ